MTSTQREIEVSYDVSNEFFRLWLDENMHYTSGSYLDRRRDARGGAAQEVQDPRPTTRRSRPDKLVLDIGCGWGSNLEYLGAHARREARPRHHALDRAGKGSTRRKLAGLRAIVCDYKDYAARREVRRARLDRDDRPPLLAGAGAPGHGGRALPRVLPRRRTWVKPGACFGFQAILRNRVPAQPQGPRGPRVHRRRHLPGRPEPAPRGARRGGEPVLGDPRAPHPARRATARPPASGCAACACTRRRSASSGATRSSTTTIATSTPACARSTNHWSSDVQMKLRKI